MPAQPKHLYHYTRFKNAKSILASGQFWLSPLSRLNDLTEGSTGFIENVQWEAFPFARTKKVQRRILELNEWLLGQIGQVYVFCFCSKDDLLSQWRGYGETQDACSLGFDFEALKKSTKFSVKGIDVSNKTQLFRMRYSKSTQIYLARKHVYRFLNGADERLGWAGYGTSPWTAREYLEMLEDPLGKKVIRLYERAYHAIADPLWQEMEDEARQGLGEAFLSSKHPKFSEEREWRIALPLNLEEVNEFVTFPNGRSVVELKAEGRDGGLPLNTLRLGPKSRRSPVGVARMLSKSGYARIPVQASDIPLRR